MRDRYVKSVENKKILYLDADNLYGWPLSQSLTCDEIKFDKNVFFRRCFIYRRWFIYSLFN